uniref:Uncharacterized protein n=1 Tax=Pinctada fucata TaxID=50426 RepID=A0A194AM49_PINFU
MSKAPVKYGFLRRTIWLFTSNPDFHKVVGPATAQRLSILFKYAKVELRPPGPGDFPKAMSQLGEISKSVLTGKYKQLTSREVVVRGFTLLDIVICFFVGEIIGKGCISGYQVPGGTNFTMALKGEADPNSEPEKRKRFEQITEEREKFAEEMKNFKAELEASAAGN